MSTLELYQENYFGDSFAILVYKARAEKMF